MDLPVRRVVGGMLGSATAPEVIEPLVPRKKTSFRKHF